MSLTTYIEDEEALDRLEAAIAAVGSANAYARSLGVSGVMVSTMRRQSKRRQPITGKVAANLNLKRVSVYRLTLVSSSPEQERYENERRNWAEQNGQKLEQSKTMRVAEEGTVGHRFPDQTTASEEKE